MILPPRKSKSKQLADALANWIRDRFAVAVESRVSPNIEFRKIKDREIKCWPATRAGELLTRGADQQVAYEVAVAVLERIQSDDQDGEDILSDELLGMAETIGDAALGLELETASGTATCTGYSHEPLFDAELMQTHRCFAGGIALEFVRIESSPLP